MNTESINCRKVAFGYIKNVGDFAFNDDFTFLYVWLPGVSGPDALEIARVENNKPRVWHWDGNKEAPTLKPSISAPGQWHGYLTAGRLESC